MTDASSGAISAGWCHDCGINPLTVNYPHLATFAWWMSWKAEWRPRSARNAGAALRPGRDATS